MSMLTTDYHIHILPGIDDGAENAQVSMRMLQVCNLQGVERVVATPHYIPHHESTADFLLNRQKAVEILQSVADQNTSGISIIPGAEVLVERGFSEREGIEKLTVAGGGYILLELPYSPFKEWMMSEIYSIMHRHKLTPVFAHMERYLQWYSGDEMSRVLSVQEAVIQINSSALRNRKTLKFTLSLIRSNFPVIFGSDAHDTDSRPPNLDAAYKIFASKLSKDELAGIIDLGNKLI